MTPWAVFLYPLKLEKVMKSKLKLWLSRVVKLVTLVKNWIKKRLITLNMQCSMSIIWLWYRIIDWQIASWLIISEFVIWIRMRKSCWLLIINQHFNQISTVTSSEKRPINDQQLQLLWAKPDYRKRKLLL